MREEHEYLSLYEFLGRAAGPKLGAEVKKYADQNDVPFKMKEVPHSGYKGKVLTYSKIFLELYFRHPIDTTHSENPTDDLPFPEGFNSNNSYDDGLPF